MLRAARSGTSTLLIAPTGGGKTLAGFLPSLVDIDGRADGEEGLVRLLEILRTIDIDPACRINRKAQHPVSDLGPGGW